MRQLFRELKRRHVFRVAAVYAVVAWVVIQVANVVFPRLDLPPWTVTLVIVLAGLGFPLALVLAWAFEMTPEGVRRTSAREGPESMSPGERRARSRLAMEGLVGLGLLGAALAGGWYLMGAGGEPEAAPGDRTIAVLPFDNLSGTEEAQPFVNGIHDDLLTRLSNISDLKVISRTSVLPYRETELSLPAIADSLGVQWIVEGGVQQAGGQVQVNAQLIDAQADVHKWAETYRRELTTENLFAVQSDLTKKIARSLEAELSPGEEQRIARRPTQDLDAYRLYVEGRTRLDQRTEQGLRRGEKLFHQAIAEDSGYAQAWSGLADARTLLAFYGYAPPDSLHPRALRAARRAVELDPDLAEAHASLGILYRNYRRNGPAALAELTRAVELKPSYARAHHWLGNVESTLGRPRRALEHLQEAAQLDPHSPSIHAALAWAYWWLDDPGGKALQHAREAAELEPGYAHAYTVEGLILSDAGRYQEAVEAFKQARERAPTGSYDWALSTAGWGTARVRAGDTALARKHLARLEQRTEAPFEEAMLTAALGQEAATRERLQAVEWSGVNTWSVRFFPLFDPFRGEPWFQELIREINRQWGLDPDGSLPDSLDVSFDSRSDY